MLHKSDGSGTPAGRRTFALLWVPARRGHARAQRAGLCLRMIFSENRAPLFGIMLYDIRPSRQAFLRTFSAWLDTNAMVQPCSVPADTEGASAFQGTQWRNQGVEIDGRHQGSAQDGTKTAHRRRAEPRARARSGKCGV